MIRGEDHIVYIDGKILLPNDSLKIVNHSPSGFSWGYMGSGPSQLALALLLEFTGDKEFSANNYMDFKEDVISKLPPVFNLKNSTVLKWILSRKSE